jgi:Glycosyl transferase family 2
MELTFVFPCLNEKGTLGTCIDQVQASLSTLSVTHEIIVADNGSTDGSIDIAKARGCRVVNVPVRGYGAALKAGILAASGDYVMFADSDNTYLYHDAAPLYQAASNSNADMAIASRMTGRIEPGAMPWLHRYAGTPVLTTLINWLFSGRLSDCNSGFRCIRKSSFIAWNVRASGMEFASELLIKALKAGARTVEISSGLRPGPPDRVAHLHTWRDGTRHLLFILSERPRLFEVAGLIVTLVATLMQITASITGPIAIAGLNIFDLHSQALLLLAGIVGAQMYVFGCALFLETPDASLGITRRLLNLHEAHLFFLLLGVSFTAGIAILFLFYTWMSAGFANLSFVHGLTAWVHLLAVGFTFSFGLLGLHILRKAKGV